MTGGSTVDILKYLALIILAVAALFLAVAVGAGLLNLTPLRRPPPGEPPQQRKEDRR
ncbi:hypothetical protein ACN27F_16785 [Solwaraspora sp. WMMB335]|uniref:hypothetical protein n=1 Tax=Solwaraspora sp. WMMB335 TaxID=3404118 RepID=UPI003B942F66